MHVEVSPQPLEFHRNVWSKPIPRQEGRSRTAVEGKESRKEWGTRPWARGNWRNTLASCWFWFPKALVCSEPGEGWGSRVWQQGLQLNRLWNCSVFSFWLVKTILSSLCVHKDWSLHARAAAVPHKWNAYCIQWKNIWLFSFSRVDSLFLTIINQKLCTDVWKHSGMWNPTSAVAVAVTTEQKQVLWSWHRCCLQLAAHPGDSSLSLGDISSSAWLTGG